MYPTTRIVIVV